MQWLAAGLTRKYLAAMMTTSIAFAALPILPDGAFAQCPQSMSSGGGDEQSQPSYRPFTAVTEEGRRREAATRLLNYIMKKGELPSIHEMAEVIGVSDELFFGKFSFFKNYTDLMEMIDRKRHNAVRELNGKLRNSHDTEKAKQDLERKIARLKRWTIFKEQPDMLDPSISAANLLHKHRARAQGFVIEDSIAYLQTHGYLPKSDRLKLQFEYSSDRLFGHPTQRAAMDSIFRGPGEYLVKLGRRHVNVIKNMEDALQQNPENQELRNHYQALSQWNVFSKYNDLVLRPEDRTTALYALYEKHRRAKREQVLYYVTTRVSANGKLPTISTLVKVLGIDPLALRGEHDEFRLKNLWSNQNAFWHDVVETLTKAHRALSFAKDKASVADAAPRLEKAIERASRHAHINHSGETGT